jgi:crossover junction endodeoxyribonuclease RusA
VSEQPTLFETLPAAPRSWRLEIPAPAEWVNANYRGHWAPKAAKVKEWRNAALLYARQAKLPKGLAHVRIDAWLHFTDKLGRDAANYGDTLKGVVDGLCRDKTHVNKKGRLVEAPGYGLIFDDTPQFLDGPFPRIGDPVSKKDYPLGLLVLDIVEDQGGAA